jgi:hypothetical protein
MVSIVSAGIAYLAQVRAQDIQAQFSKLQYVHERQKPFVELQMKYYFETAEITSQIPQASDEEARHKLIERFWQLYWGPLGVVEDDEMQTAMIAYGKELMQKEENPGKLKNLSLDVAHACRTSLKRLWVPELTELTKDRSKVQ